MFGRGGVITRELPVTLTLPPPKTARSEGVHVSSIIRCIALETGILKPEHAEELSLSDARTITDPTAILRICIGLAFEEWYLPTVLEPQGVVDHPGEMCLDGIYLTHDGESVDVVSTERGSSIATVVHELKATYKSCSTVGDLTNQWLWRTQLQAYCKALGTRFAKMHVLFLCGDYKFPIKPQLRCWEIEFSQSELDSTWELLTDYRDHKLAMEGE